MKKRTKILLLVLAGTAFVLGVLTYVNRNALKNSLVMQSYSYDNGFGETFRLKFYNDSNVMLSSEARLKNDNEETSGEQGNIITQSNKEVGLTLQIMKRSETLDIRNRSYCTRGPGPVFTYKSGITNEQVPVCLVTERDGQHIIYFSQIDSPRGRNLVMIAQDYDANGVAQDTERAKKILPQIDLRRHQADIKYILSSIELE